MATLWESALPSMLPISQPRGGKRLLEWSPIQGAPAPISRYLPNPMGPSRRDLLTPCKLSSGFRRPRRPAGCDSRGGSGAADHPVRQSRRGSRGAVGLTALHYLPPVRFCRHSSGHHRRGALRAGLLFGDPAPAGNSASEWRWATTAESPLDSGLHAGLLAAYGLIGGALGALALGRVLDLCSSELPVSIPAVISPQPRGCS